MFFALSDEIDPILSVIPAKAGIQSGRPGQSLFAIGPEGLAREERAERDVLDPRFRGGDRLKIAILLSD
jgi:hypothetical protein